MSGSLRDAWEYFGGEVWGPLADYATKDAVAPSDLFNNLLAAADEFLSPRLTDTEMEEARNNTDKARHRFLSLRGTDFASECDIVHFLEEANRVIADYEIPGLVEHYRRTLGVKPKVSCISVTPGIKPPS